MPTDLMNSKTKENLMRAYAGEALTCSRYKAAEEQCRAAKSFQIHLSSGGRPRRDLCRASQRVH